MTENQKNYISFVSPLFNEEDCIEELYTRVKDTAQILHMDFELIYVDDGSTDHTLEKLKLLRNSDPKVKIISFSRNFGHQVAVSAGLRYASGVCVAVLDGDLQDPPEVVIEMVKKWREGYNVVFGVRRTRQERWLKSACYKIFYRLLNKLARVDIPLDAGDFCLMDRMVVLELNSINEYNPFVRGLRAWVGFSQTSVAYERPARLAGETKYSYLKLIRLALHGFISFSDLILNSAALMGIFVSIFSLLYGVWIAVNRILITFGILNSEDLIPGWATIVCIITFLIGLVFIYLGILGKYIGYIFMQCKNRPLFIVKEELGFDAKIE